MSPTKAVVYIPDDLDGDEALLARRGVVHIERRGYRLAGVLRTWKHVLDQAAAGAVVVFARKEHAAAVSKWSVAREFVGEDTCRLVPVVQGVAAGRAVAALPGGRHSASAAPFDESPTVALLDRWRAARRHNGDEPSRYPRGDDGGFAERFLRNRRNGRDT